MKKILLALLFVFATTGMASAITLPIGPVTFHMTNWENRVTATGQTLSGIFQIDQLLNSSNATVWNSGMGGEYLYGTFGNSTLTTINDFGPTGESTGDQYLFSGGNLKVYLGTSAINPTNSTTWTAGSLWLDLAMVTGVDFTNPGYTLVSSITGAGADPETVPAIKGIGTALLDVVGGSVASQFDTNTYQRYDGTGLKADVYLNNSFFIRYAPEQGLTGNKDGFPVWSKDPIGANVIPEPTSMLLLGMGLTGLATRLLKRKVA